MTANKTLCGTHTHTHTLRVLINNSGLHCKSLHHMHDYTFDKIFVSHVLLMTLVQWVSPSQLHFNDLKRIDVTCLLRDPLISRFPLRGLLQRGALTDMSVQRSSLRHVADEGAERRCWDAWEM